MAARRAPPTCRCYLRKGPSGSVTSLNDGRLSIEPPAADEGGTSYTYPDWEWVNGVVVNGPDGRPDPVRRVLTFTTAPLTADLEVTGPIVLKLFASSTRSTPSSSSSFPTSIRRTRRRAQKASSRRSRRSRRAGSRPRTARRTRSARPTTAAVLHPHQSAAAHARRDLRVRHRGAAGLIRVQEGPPHPARDRQRRLAA